MNSTKLSIPLIFLLLVALSAKSQKTIIHLQVFDRAQKPFPNLSIELREESNSAHISSLSDKLGACDFVIESGSAWKLWIDGFPYPQYLFERTDDISSETSVTITHDTAHLNRLSKQVFLRKRISFDTIVNTGVKRRPDKGFYLSIVTVRDKAQRAVPGIPISFIDVSKGKGYTSFSNANGQVLFYLPHSSNYDIDVADQCNAYTQDMHAEEDITAYKTVIYDPYKLKEIRKGDTITQTFPRSTDRHLSRAWFELKMTRTKGRIYNQPVYLNEIGSNTVYKAMTDSAGETIFLLPHGKKYMVHFRFQRDVDVVDLSMSRQDAFSYMQLKYDPEDRLVNRNIFIPREDQLVPVDFRKYYKPDSVSIEPEGWTILPKRFEIKKGTASSDLLLQLELHTQAQSVQKRKPLNLSFILDCSGSMAGYERIESLKEGLLRLIPLLDRKDRISVVRFSDNATLILPSQILGADTSLIKHLIARLDASGSTNMLPALEISYNQIMQHYDPAAMNMVVILSDGYDSNPVDTLLSVQKPFREKVYCTTIGVGQDYNQGLLDKLSTVSGTAYNFHAEGRSLSETMPMAVMSFLQPLAKNIIVEVSYGAGWQYSGLYGADSVIVSKGKVRFKIPFIYAGLQMPFLIHFSGKGAPNSIRYSVVATPGQESVDSFDKPFEPLAEASRKMLLIAMTQRQIRIMAQQYELGRKKEAAAALQKALQTFKLLNIPEDDPDAKTLKHQLKQYQEAMRNAEIIKKLEAEDI